MKILLSWLREYLPFTVEPAQLATDLSLLGLAVDAIEQIGDETLLDLDVTTNRPDCLSHYGVAREVAARYGLPLAAAGEARETPQRRHPKDSPVEIQATERCGRYSARILRGVAVKPSPPWLAQRLEMAGIRSINNIADATNYILMAYGHPLHAFDMDRLRDGSIIVRQAHEKERLRTLDGVDRELSTEDLVIADSSHAVALAGVMGGQETEISSATSNVLIESAWFDPVSIRRTAKRHGMHTEASHRFERGADPQITLMAANRCAEMILELAGGELDPAEVDASTRPPSRTTVLLRRWELERHLGMEMDPAEVKKILHDLGFLPKEKGRIGWNCTTPSHRVDVSREIDLIEEVARVYGYDRFPLRLPALLGEATHQPTDTGKENRLLSLLLGLGYDETISHVMVNRTTERYSDSVPVALSNPLSEEAAVLRTSIVPGLLAALQWNLNRGQENVRLIEFGRTYSREGDGFQERPVLGIAATGERVAAHVGAQGRDFDFFDLKGDVEQALELFAGGEARFEAAEMPGYYRPGHGCLATLDGSVAARIGQLSLGAAEDWKMKRPIFLAELFLDVLFSRPLRAPQAGALSRFPAVERDFSIVLPDGTAYETVRNTIAALEIPELREIQPVDIFRGKSVPDGHFSLLLRLRLQSNEATLTEADLADRSSRIIQAMESTLGARVRMGG